MQAIKNDKELALLEGRFSVQRGSLIALKKPLTDSSNLAIVVSNNLQNEMSDVLLVVPLERRVARLRAPFAIDLGRSQGMRDLHTARCDWVTKIWRSDIQSIERARFPDEILLQLEACLKVALGFAEVL